MTNTQTALVAKSAAQYCKATHKIPFFTIQLLTNMLPPQSIQAWFFEDAKKLISKPIETCSGIQSSNENNQFLRVSKELEKSCFSLLIAHMPKAVVENSLATALLLTVLIRFWNR